MKVQILKLHGENGDEVETISRGADRGGGDHGGGEIVKVVILDANGHEVSGSAR